MQSDADRHLTNVVRNRTATQETPPADRKEARPLPPSQKPSAIIHQDQLERARPTFERYAAAGLLFLSVLGTIAALSGWDALRALHPSWFAVAGGLTVQALCTAIEYLYRHKRISPIYLLALVFDAGPTALGYLPIIKQPLASAATMLTLTGRNADMFIYGIVVVVSLLLAWIPEGRLID